MPRARAPPRGEALFGNTAPHAAARAAAARQKQREQIEEKKKVPNRDAVVQGWCLLPVAIYIPPSAPLHHQACRDPSR